MLVKRFRVGFSENVLIHLTLAPTIALILLILAPLIVLILLTLAPLIVQEAGRGGVLRIC